MLVLDTNTGAVLRVDPKSLAAAEIMRIPGYPAAIAVGAGAAWVVDSRRGTVTRVTETEFASSAGSHVVGLVAYARSEGS